MTEGNSIDLLTLNPAKHGDSIDLLKLNPSEKKPVTDQLDDALLIVIEDLQNKPMNGIYQINEALKAIHDALTQINCYQQANYQLSRGVHKTAYDDMGAAHRKKAWVQLISGIVGGGFQIASSAIKNDTLKGIMEAVGKTSPSVGGFVTNMTDAEIQGELTYLTRKVESMMDEERQMRQKGEGVDHKAAESARQMMQALSRA